MYLFSINYPEMKSALKNKFQPPRKGAIFFADIAVHAAEKYFLFKNYYKCKNCFTATAKSPGLSACTQCDAFFIFTNCAFGNCCLIENSSCGKI